MRKSTGGCSRTSKSSDEALKNGFEIRGYRGGFEVHFEDRFEDDYIGSVITNQDGYLEISFGKKVFSDFGLEQEPDVYFKIFTFEAGAFKELKRIMPEIFEKTCN